MADLTELDRFSTDLKKKINERANQDNDFKFEKIDKLEKIKNESLKDFLNKDESLSDMSVTLIATREYKQPYNIIHTRMAAREHGQPYKKHEK